MLKRILLSFGVLIAALAVGLASFLSQPQTAQGAIPTDFTDTLVASVGSPTALAFTPDGRLLITTQGGSLRVVQNGNLLATAALNLSAKLCAGGERGLLGVAVDPSFASNRYIYLFYTFKKFNVCENNTANSPVNRVSRFVLADNNTVDAAGETVLVDNMPSPNGNHNAGDLHFGKDGFLYISIGDGGCDYAGNSGCAGANDAARDRHVLTGQILRVTRDGNIPASNPYQGSDSARCNVTGRTDPGKKCQEIFAWGLRNPFRMAFDPNASGTRFFINDVGQNVWEEINNGQAGADYGWNVREGFCANGSTSNCGAPPSGMVNPVYAYGRNTGCASITGGAFVPNGIWPAAYNSAYLYSDYVCGKIVSLTPNGSGGYNATDFVTGLGANSAVHLTFGPHNGSQALYYTNYRDGGQVRRVAYTGNNNRPPVASVTANPSTGAAPLAVTFDGSASSDPDAGNTLTYIWNFGNGATRETATPTTVYTYTTIGIYTATLTVRDNGGLSSAPASVRIDAGNTPPVPQILAPTTTDRYAVGQTITLNGRATDDQDGTLPASALSWKVIIHHNTHTHPFFGPQSGNNLTFAAPAPEDLLATATSYLEIELTATDSAGRSSVVRQNIQPKQVNVTFATEPSGLELRVNDVTITGTKTLLSWEGYVLNVNAPEQSLNGQTYQFSRWADGGTSASRTITTAATPLTYTAIFTPVSTPGGTGLKAEYYDNDDLTNLKLTRTDATVNFDWGTGSPDATIGADTFSVRWSGQVQPQYSETYTFYTTSDDGIRLWVNGQKIIDNWTDHAATENSGTITLAAGTKYSIVLEFYERGGFATAKLAWSSPSQPKQIVPQTRLFPTVSFSAKINFQPTASPVPAGYVADGGAVYGNRGNGYTYGWNADNSTTTRDRNATNSPDQRYDTLAHLQKPENPNAVWEIAVPNGTYTVKVVSGDPSHFDGVFKLNVEGTLAVNGTPTSSNRWVEGTVTVTVSDGKLTITNAAGASNNKICFIEVSG
jgi:glucose/arabinose dehydrogenase